ncbi:hypothetical protein [Flaviaesturariibacter amylovorans]|uniref:Uncharacterized protein n=1 Tax=Flaviaesturariibacter amylovorans TaxID=1084520 RepID=A0ABP8HRB2_9BACT
MRTGVEPRFVKKNKAVYTAKELPVNHGFGNKYPIAQDAKGYVVSDGFEAGMLRVLFSLHQGNERVQFNAESARHYLECDPY